MTTTTTITIKDTDALAAAEACWAAQVALNAAGGMLATEVGGAYGDAKRATLHALAVAFGGLVNDYAAAERVYDAMVESGEGPAAMVAALNRQAARAAEADDVDHRGTTVAERRVLAALLPETAQTPAALKRRMYGAVPVATIRSLLGSLEAKGYARPAPEQVTASGSGATPWVSVGAGVVGSDAARQSSLAAEAAKDAEAALPSVQREANPDGTFRYLIDGETFLAASHVLYSHASVYEVNDYVAGLTTPVRLHKSARAAQNAGGFGWTKTGAVAITEA